MKIFNLKFCIWTIELDEIYGIPVYSKGENVCDWLYVEDYCRAIDLIIHKGKVYNVGGHNEMKNIDIVKDYL